MMQLVIVYIIIVLAIAYTVYAVLKTLKVKNTGACGGDCACSAKTDIHKAMKKYKRHQIKIQSLAK